MSDNWKQTAEALQRQSNEQYEEIKKLKALVRILIGFIFDRDQVDRLDNMDFPP